MNSGLTQNPLIIIGGPRSGTSLLRLIINAHSDVLVPPECGFIIWLYPRYSEWNVVNSNDPTKVAAFVDDLLGCKKMDTWQLDRTDVAKHIQSLQPENYADLCGTVYLAYATRMGRKVQGWGDKNNFHIHHLDELRSIYEDARFLHIVRDGRDVACSYREVMNSSSDSPYAPVLETDIDGIAAEWSGNVMKVDSFVKLLPPEKGTTIRYEDLVSDPSKVVAELCRWLELLFEPEMLLFYKGNRARNLEPRITLDWKKRTLGPISSNTVGRYKKLLNDEEISRFNDIAAIALRKFDYL